MIIWIDQLAEQGLDTPGDSTLSIVFTDLMEEIAYYLDFGRKAGVAAGLTEKQEKQVGIYRDSGYRNFLNAFDWPFLRPTLTKTLWAAASGTTSGTPSYDGENGSIVTATAAKFFDTMVGSEFKFVTSAVTYTITGFSSSTVIEVQGDASGEASGDTFTIATTGAYRLPGDFGGIIGDITFAPDEGYFAPLPIRSESQVRRMLQGSTDSGRPIYAAVRPATTDGTKGQRHDLLSYPIPDADYPVSFQYNVIPDAMTSAAEFPYGGTMHNETIKAACIAAAELSTREQRGARWQDYQDRLQESIRRERYANTPDSLGYNADNSDISRADLFRRTKVVTVGGVSYP